MKKSHFFWWLVIFMWFLMWLLVIFWLGLGNPRHIATSKSPFYMVVVLVWKSWDSVRSPPTSLGQNPIFYQKMVFKAPLISISSIVMCETCSSSSVDKQGHGSPPPSCQCQDGNFDKQGRLQNCVGCIDALMMMLIFRALCWTLWHWLGWVKILKAKKGSLWCMTPTCSKSTQRS